MAAESIVEPPKKKRKLPPLDESFDGPTAKTDDPTLHQGRKRSSPHVVGQWASHIYVSITPSSKLLNILRKAVQKASKERPDVVHSLLPEDDTPLHLSLSRPLMLRFNQRSELIDGVSSLSTCTEPFKAHFATFAVLENDDKTRRFLGIEIGSGYSEFQSLLSTIDSHLKSMRLPPYYAQPRFHISIAWSSLTSISSTATAIPFDETTLNELEISLGKQLREEEVWVREVGVKVGKKETLFSLGK